MSVPINIRQNLLGRVLIVFGVLYIIALVGMGLVFSANPPTNLLRHADELRGMLGRYRCSFMLVILLGPSLVTLITTVVAAKWVRQGVRLWDVLGLLFLFTYIPFQSIAYGSQFTILPHLLGTDLQQASLWYFQNTHSIPYGLDLLGYALFGVAALFLSMGMVRVFKWYAFFLFFCGATSVVAYALLGFGIESLAGVLSLVSASLTLPILALSFKIGIDLIKSDAAGD